MTFHAQATDLAVALQAYQDDANGWPPGVTLLCYRKIGEERWTVVPASSQQHATAGQLIVTLHRSCQSDHDQAMNANWPAISDSERARIQKAGKR